MINSSPRWVAIALAAAVLSVSAAAQSDASFAAALGDPPAGLATAAQLKTEPQAPAKAAAQPLAAPAETWRKIRARVMSLSEYSPIIGGVIVEDFLGDPKGERTDQTITFFGSPDRSGAFVFEEACVEFYEEKRDPASGNYLTQTWTFYVDIDGKVTGHSHTEGLSAPDKRHLSGGPVKIPRADPKVSAAFDAMINYWAAR